MSTFGIVISEFNQEITEALRQGAHDFLKSAQPSIKLEDVWVPGAFELPLMAQAGLQHKGWDAAICLGCVVKGETPHFDFVCNEAARGIMETSLKFGKPCIFGVVTTNNWQQAKERAGLAPRSNNSDKTIFDNKGKEAATAALKLHNALTQWQGEADRD